MPKKSFKDNTANIDRFFSDAPQDTPDTQNTDNTHDTQQTYSTGETRNAQKPQKIPQTFYRLNLKLRGDFRQYLDDEAWKARKSITEYLNDLIAADMEEKRRREE